MVGGGGRRGRAARTASPTREIWWGLGRLRRAASAVAPNGVCETSPSAGFNSVGPCLSAALFDSSHISHDLTCKSRSTPLPLPKAMPVGARGSPHYTPQSAPHHPNHDERGKMKTALYWPFRLASTLSSIFNAGASNSIKELNGSKYPLVPAAFECSTQN
jgi:hypothetical protein